MWKDKLGTCNANAKVLQRIGSFEEIALKIELLIWVFHIQLRVAKLTGKLTWGIWLHVASHSLMTHQMFWAKINKPPEVA